jgi:Na+/H+-translocating membrane pyrophosphatase
MGVKSAAFTVIAILGIIVGAGYAIIMTFHTLLVGSSVSRGSEDDKRSVTSRLFGNGIAVAVGAVLITSVMILVGMIRAGGLAGLRERRKPVPYMQAMNFPPDRRYEVFGTAPSTPLGKLLAKVDRIVFVLFGVRIVGTDLLIAARMASMAEASPQLRKVFGPQDDYREGVAALAKDWQGGAPFNRCAGLIGFHHYIKQAMDSRQSVIQYHVAHPEVSKLPVARPLLLIGLPRTGTTLLHRLLSLDPMSRTLRNWECCKPVRGPISPATCARLCSLPCPRALCLANERSCVCAGASTAA